MSKKLFDGAAIFVPVTNLKQSASWYEKNLGFVIRDWDEPDAVNLTLGNDFLMCALIKCEKFEPPQFPKNDYAVDVFFNFHSLDVDGLHKKLSENEVKVSQMFQLGNHRFFSFFDPDGNKYGAVQNLTAR
jgi:lactoylglutathione lyase